MSTLFTTLRHFYQHGYTRTLVVRPWHLMTAISAVLFIAYYAYDVRTFRRKEVTKVVGRTIYHKPRWSLRWTKHEEVSV